MAQYKRYVNHGADPGGNGATSNTSSGDGTHAFQHLSDAEADGTVPANLTTNGDTYVIECAVGGSPSDDHLAVTWSGWTTSASYCITVQTDSGSKAGTSWSSSKYRLSRNATCMTISQASLNLNLVGLQFEQNVANQSADAHCIVMTAASTVLIDSCFLKNKATNTSYFAYCVGHTGQGTINCIRSVLIGRLNRNQTAQGVFYNYGTNSVSNIYNCVIVGGYTALRTRSGTVNIKNTYLTGTVCISSAGTTNQTKNATSDATAADAALDNVAYSTSSGAYFTNVSSDTEDLNITDNTSTLTDAGSDTSGESAPFNYSTDMLGNALGTRDIGVVAIASPAGGQPIVKRFGGVYGAAVNMRVW